MTKANTGVSLAALQAKIAELEAELTAKAPQRTGRVSITEKGQIAVTFPAGDGFLTDRWYAWHWAEILKYEKEIRAAFKDKRAMTEAAFRANKKK